MKRENYKTRTTFQKQNKQKKKIFSVQIITPLQLQQETKEDANGTFSKTNVKLNSGVPFQH